MPAEDYEKSRSRTHSFDRLAKGLASGKVSRRGALRLFGAALFGGLLAGVPGVAVATPVSPPPVSPPPASPPGQGRCPDRAEKVRP